MSVLKVINLTKIFYGGFWPFSRHKEYRAVDAVSLNLNQGEILGFLGPNGAGKTTTIQMLLGVLTPTSGSIEFFGKDFAAFRSEILQKVTFASGYDKLPARLTILQNLDIISRMYALPSASRTKRIQDTLQFFGLWEMRHKETGSLSAGQATRVMLAKAFLPEPQIVLLDEPTAALDPDVASQVREFIIKQKKEHGTAVLLTSHNMDEVTQVCDRVLVIKQGKIIADNTPSQLAASVSYTRLHLVISAGLVELISLLDHMNLRYQLHESGVAIDIDEHQIAAFLGQVAVRPILYSHIAIDKPTLEDYFLHITRK